MKWLTFALGLFLMVEAVAADAGRKVLLSFDSGLEAELLEVTKLDNLPFASLPTRTESELLLMHRYFTTRTLDEVTALLPPGSATWTQATFDSWVKSRDLQQRSIEGLCRFRIGETYLRVVMYQNVFDGRLVSDPFRVREHGDRVEMMDGSNDQPMIAFSNYLRMISFQWFAALLSPTPARVLGFADASREAATFNQMLATNRRENGAILADRFAAALMTLSASTNPAEKAVATALLRPPPGSPVNPVLLADITAQTRTTHAPLLDYLEQLKLSPAQKDEVLLQILNKQYVAAASTILQHSDRPRSSLREFALKINELYGPVIQMSGGR